MPVYKCPNGKYRIGSGPCVFTSEEKAEKAYAAYKAKKHNMEAAEMNENLETGLFEVLGGRGSGNFGHGGRPGKVGGSGSGKGKGGKKAAKASEMLITEGGVVVTKEPKITEIERVLDPYNYGDRAISEHFGLPMSVPLKAYQLDLQNVQAKVIGKVRYISGSSAIYYSRQEAEKGWARMLKEEGAKPVKKGTKSGSEKPKKQSYADYVKEKRSQSSRFYQDDKPFDLKPERKIKGGDPGVYRTPGVKIHY